MVFVIFFNSFPFQSSETAVGGLPRTPSTALTRKESYKAQRQHYRREKKRAASALLHSIEDPSVVVLADWLKVSFGHQYNLNFKLDTSSFSFRFFNFSFLRLYSLNFVHFLRLCSLLLFSFLRLYFLSLIYFLRVFYLTLFSFLRLYFLNLIYIFRLCSLTVFSFLRLYFLSLTYILRLCSLTIFSFLRIYFISLVYFLRLCSLNLFSFLRLYSLS